MNAVVDLFEKQIKRFEEIIEILEDEEQKAELEKMLEYMRSEYALYKEQLQAEAEQTENNKE